MKDMIQQFHSKIQEDLKQGDFDSVISNCQEILKSRDSDWRAKFYLGYAEICKKQTLVSTDDVAEMNRHIEKTVKDTSFLSFMEQERAFREISKQLLEYAENNQNEIQKACESAEDEEVKDKLRNRSFHAYGSVLALEKLLSEHVNATGAMNMLSNGLSKMKAAYPVLEDFDVDVLEKSGKRTKKPKKERKPADKKPSGGKPSKFFLVIGVIILLLLTVFGLKTLYDHLSLQRNASSQNYEEQMPAEQEPVVQEPEAQEPETPLTEVQEPEEPVEEEQESETTTEEPQSAEESAEIFPIYYYELDQKITTGNTGYEPGSPFEVMVDACKDAQKNPTILVHEELNKYGIMFESTEVNLSQMSDVGMSIYISEDEKENKKAETYDFTSQGSQKLLGDILNHMSGSQLFDKYSVKKIYADAVKQVPVFSYSPEDIPCYYTFIQIRFEGMAYLWQIYTSSNDGEHISKITAEMLGVRYIQGGGAGSSLTFAELDLKIFANQMLFMEAAEYLLTGKREIFNWLDLTRSTVSDTSHDFKTKNGNWTESVQFYQASGMDKLEEAWIDSKISKAEICIEKK